MQACRPWRAADSRKKRATRRLPMSRPKPSGTTVKTVSTWSLAMRVSSASKVTRPGMARMLAHRVEFAKPRRGGCRVALRAGLGAPRHASFENASASAARVDARPSALRRSRRRRVECAAAALTCCDGRRYGTRSHGSRAPRRCLREEAGPRHRDLADGHRRRPRRGAGDPPARRRNGIFFAGTRRGEANPSFELTAQDREFLRAVSIKPDR